MQRNDCRDAAHAVHVDSHRGTGGFSAAGFTGLVITVVLAMAPGLARALSITAIAGTPQSTPVNMAFADLVVEVRDGSGAPAPGVLVTFQGPSLGPSVSFPTGSIDFTDTAGRASVSVKANFIAGSFSVWANTSGLPSVPFALTNAPGAPSAVKTSGGVTRTAQVDTPFSIDFKAEVRDQYSNLVAGATVTFTAPESGASVVFPGGTAAVTNASGVASAAAVANTVAGAYQVGASSGTATPATFEVTNRPGPATVIITNGSPQATPITLPFPKPLQVEVSDEFGNLIAGATVVFSGPMTGASAVFSEGSLAQTNSRGQAAVVAEANTIAGGYLVTASVPGAVAGTFQLWNLSPSDVAPWAPGAFGFVNATPNPFNPSTTISFDLAVGGVVALDVFDLAGRHVRSLVAKEWFAAGRQTVPWDGRDDRLGPIASGVYHCVLRTGDGVDVLAVVLLK